MRILRLNFRITIGTASRFEEAILTGKVFVSCGQAEASEKEAAGKVSELLKAELKLDTYLAFRIQSLHDIMRITDQLRICDYFLFIDFKRLSVFTHQELALAHHLGFGGDIIALRQNGAGEMQGFLRYVLSNPTPFETTDELLANVRELVRAKGWNCRYSRNLVVNSVLGRSTPVSYVDQTGASIHELWRAKIENHRPDTAAVGVICILDFIRLPSGENLPSRDRGYLKWVGHKDYERTILPESAEQVDIFAVQIDRPGIFLLSSLDAAREPMVTENGDYELNYLLFARDFPVRKFTVKVHLHWQPTVPIVWANQTQAELV